MYCTLIYKKLSDFYETDNLYIYTDISKLVFINNFENQLEYVQIILSDMYVQSMYKIPFYEKSRLYTLNLTQVSHKESYMISINIRHVIN